MRVEDEDSDEDEGDAGEFCPVEPICENEGTHLGDGDEMVGRVEDVEKTDSGTWEFSLRDFDALRIFPSKDSAPEHQAFQELLEQTSVYFIRLVEKDKKLQNRCGLVGVSQLWPRMVLEQSPQNIEIDILQDRCASGGHVERLTSLGLDFWDLSHLKSTTGRNFTMWRYEVPLSFLVENYKRGMKRSACEKAALQKAITKALHRFNWTLPLLNPSSYHPASPLYRRLQAFLVAALDGLKKANPGLDALTLKFYKRRLYAGCSSCLRQDQYSRRLPNSSRCKKCAPDFAPLSCKMPNQLTITVDGDRSVKIHWVGMISTSPNMGPIQHSDKWRTVLHVEKDGSAWASTKQFDVDEFLEWWLSDASGNGASFGVMTGSCVFCGMELTDVESLRRGYGPVCAKTHSTFNMSFFNLKRSGLDVTSAQSSSCLRNVQLESPQQMEKVSHRMKNISLVGVTLDGKEVLLKPRVVNQSSFLLEMICDLDIDEGIHEGRGSVPLQHAQYQALDKFLETKVLHGRDVLDLLVAMDALEMPVVEDVRKAVALKLRHIKTKKEFQSLLDSECDVLDKM